MRLQRNYYEVLGVSPNASQQAIKEKYLDLARIYHPDRAKDKNIADRLFVQINRAYTTLRNPKKRAQYDASLSPAAQGPLRPAVSRPQTAPNGQPAQSPPPQAPPQNNVQGIRELFDEASRLQMRGELAKALDLCSKVIAADPVNFPGLLLTGDLLAQTGKESEAIEIYERASKLQPANRMVREKISRISALMARKATSPGIASQRPPSNGTGPSSPSPMPTPPLKRPTPTPAPAASKSFLDRLINRK